MSLEALFGIAMVVVLAVGILKAVAPKRMPPQPSFSCGRCHTLTKHNNRTIEAWRDGKTKFFCPACHTKWLQTQPPRERGTYRGSSGGCLGLVVVAAMLPIGVFLVVRAVA